jgi:hypothetical protein
VESLTGDEAYTIGFDVLTDMATAMQKAPSHREGAFM